ncbi:MAG TPA: hypothetical protein VEX68_05600 [Bryobacteraceae bacterium]|nr:hypothetical protein [Bryobacteraceae bacterium]
MRHFLAITFGILGSVVCSFPAVDPDLPSPAPKVAGIFPHGAQRGSVAEVELSGQNLHDTASVQFAGKGVTAEILSASASKLGIRVTVDATAETGRRDFRLTTGRGVYVGVFDIGALPEIRETEKNDDYRKPQPISLPVLVKGIIADEDWDHFGFKAEAGETLVFDVSATRHGSRLDADLAILDERGEELAWVDDVTIFGDPHLEYTFEKSGSYVVRVGSLGGGPTADYRLSVGRLPYVRRAMPAGLGTKQPTVVTLTGVHLDQLDEVVLGDGTLRGEILGKSSKQARVRFRTPADVAPGSYKLHARSKGREIVIPTVMQVSPLPEITVATPPIDFSKALEVRPSTVINGAIEQPRASHYFRFAAHAGETFVFGAQSMKLGYHLDPTVTLFDSTGAKLAFADDPGADERSDEYQLDHDLSYRFAKDGMYVVAVRDGMYRGGEQLVYRLTVERRPPEFIVELREPTKTLYMGQEDTIQVRVRRRADWTSPVDVWLEGLPEGVVTEKRTAEPKNTIVKDTCGVDREVDGTIVLLPVRASNGQPGRSEFLVKGRGVMNGTTVEHTAIVRYEHAAAGHTYGPMQIQKSEMTIATAPKVLLSMSDRIHLDAGKETPVTVNVRRFGDAKSGPIKLRASGRGVKPAEVEVPETARNAKLPVAISQDAESARLVVQAVGADGQVLGESAPVMVQATIDKEADKQP